MELIILHHSSAGKDSLVSMSKRLLTRRRESCTDQFNIVGQSMIPRHLKTAVFIRALTLRLLAGGSYLDLALLFEMLFTYSYVVFHDVIGDWILDNRFVKIDGAEYCSDLDWMSTVALDFSS